jgi:hypothetical protein
MQALIIAATAEKRDHKSEAKRSEVRHDVSPFIGGNKIIQGFQ